MNKEKIYEKLEKIQYDLQEVGDTINTIEEELEDLLDELIND